MNNGNNNDVHVNHDENSSGVDTTISLSDHLVII